MLDVESASRRALRESGWMKLVAALEHVEAPTSNNRISWLATVLLQQMKTWSATDNYGVAVPVIIARLWPRNISGLLKQAQPGIFRNQIKGLTIFLQMDIALRF
jgi:hypothetical protein